MNAKVTQSTGWQAYITRIFPFLQWLPELRHWPTLRADIIAGLTVAMLLIPQSMAYAHLAGLPVYMGLYAAFIPPIVAALFGSSRSLSTGPVPVTALLTAVGLQSVAAIGTSEYLSFLVLLTFLAGAIQIALSLLRFGVVVNFISYPVLLGLINAVAIIIACMQLHNLFGVYAVPGAHLYQMVWQVIGDAITNPNWPTIAIALLAFIIILLGRWLRPNWPHILLAVIITSAVSWLGGYEKMKVIAVDQIINPAVQQMMKNYQSYPKAMQKQLEDAAKAQENLSQTIAKAGKIAQETDKAIDKAAQAKLKVERMIARHNLETA
jgi:SulP family sulfate permease